MLYGAPLEIRMNGLIDELQRQRQTRADHQAVAHIGEGRRAPLGAQIVRIGGLSFGIAFAVGESVVPEQEQLLVIDVGATVSMLVRLKPVVSVSMRSCGSPNG